MKGIGPQSIAAPLAHALILRQTSPVLPWRWIGEGSSEKIDKGAYAVTEVTSALIDRENRIFIVALVFREKLDQSALCEIVSDLHFSQARNA